VDTESGMAMMFASEVALECVIDSMRVPGGYVYSMEFEVRRSTATRS
jgi:alkylation response protein AidB-like acyl-CoA dehydrogenase